jgi:hypothetical protein
MGDGASAGQALVGDFDGADDLLGAAQLGSLAALGPVLVEKSGRIGPLFEIIRAREACPDAFSDVSFRSPVVSAIEAARTESCASGLSRGARFGVFPLALLPHTGDLTDAWKLWASRADQAAKTAGFPDLVAAEIIGALGELRDNVFRHSRACASGLVAFAAATGTFEVVVSDGGVGVLSTLREHVDYAAVEDAGTALRLAVAEGESRFGRSSGAGFGMGQMFRALAGHDGDLRFRSGDHALEVRGHSPSLAGRVELRQKAALPGLTVSVLCRTSSRLARPL